MGLPRYSLEGKVAAIVGARRGIGKDVALTFAEAGANIALCDHTTETGELEAVATEVQKVGRQSLAVQMDVT